MANLIDYYSVSPRFSVKSEQSLKEAVDYLHQNGYVVISDILDEDQIATSKELIWKFISETSNGEVKREDPNTWTDKWPTSGSHGILYTDGIGQSDFVWYIRTNPDARKVFQKIWNTEQLLVSFDGCSIFRDWNYKPEWKTAGAWNHVDQNPVQKPQLACVQGLVTLYDQNDETGGLIVYPQSHLQFTDLSDIVKHSDDFLLVPDNHPVMENRKTPGKLVHAKAGDLILWDSRTIHCNTPAVTSRPYSPNQLVEFLRLVSYVCMMPVTSVTDQPLEEFRKKRIETVENGRTTSHWCNAFTSRKIESLPKKPIEQFSDEQKALILGY